MSAMSSHDHVQPRASSCPAHVNVKRALREANERSGAHFISAQRSLRGEEVKKGEPCRLTLLDLASRAITDAFARVLLARGGDRGDKEFKGIA